MSKEELQAMQVAEIILTPKEYYNFRDLAIKHQVPYTNEYKNGGVHVNVEVPFLIAYGYLDLVKF